MDRKWWTLVAVCTATFMLLLDITIVNVALPSIERDLGADLADLQWVVDAYALTLAALLLTGGSVADRVGRRRVFLIGLVVFTVASVLCGLATSPLTLNLARAVQGVGGAFMFATSLALLASAYSGRDRGTALGLWGATTGAAVAVGPLVGGILTEAIGWEAIFFVNVPIGIVAVLLTLARVEESKNPVAGRPDWLGTVLFSGALFLLIFGLIRGNPEGWSSAQIVASLGGAAVLLIAFVIVEMRSEHAMLDLRLFRVPSFVGASIAAFVLSASMFAMFLYLTLYIQNILGYSALQSGIRFMPVTLLSFAVAPVSGKFAERLGARWFIAGGLVLVGVGLLLMGGLDPGDDWTALLAGFLVAGGGIGCVNPALATAAIGVVDPRRSGMASGINSTFRQVGIATGIAAWGAIFQHVVRQEFVQDAARAGVRGAGQRGGDLADFIAFGGARRSGNPQLARLGEQAFVTGLNHLLLLAGLLALVGALGTALLIRAADFRSAHA
ncbi:MAG TPA: MFS transporter [Solirubrobacteraceae bacterium]|nr:MFS transporter [Solirubrobacteraceae bacterium]